jgi:hypothetical protein
VLELAPPDVVIYLAPGVGLAALGCLAVWLRRRRRP